MNIWSTDAPFIKKGTPQKQVAPSISKMGSLKKVKMWINISDKNNPTLNPVVYQKYFEGAKSKIGIYFTCRINIWAIYLVTQNQIEEIVPINSLCWIQ